MIVYTLSFWDNAYLPLTIGYNLFPDVTRLLVCETLDVDSISFECIAQCVTCSMLGACFRATWI